MLEDELLEGVTDALTVGGWLWSHQRRSDLAITQGTPGIPDLFAVHHELGRFLALELKSDHGEPTRDQTRWLVALSRANVDTRLVYPDQYDPLIVELVGNRLKGHVRRRA
jgi:hypothetical protein